MNSQFQVHDGKRVRLTTVDEIGVRVGRGVRIVEKTCFGWAAKTPDGSDVIDLSLAREPKFEPIENETPAEALERHERAIRLEK